MFVTLTLVLFAEGYLGACYGVGALEFASVWAKKTVVSGVR